MKRLLLSASTAAFLLAATSLESFAAPEPVFTLNKETAGAKMAGKGFLTFTAKSKPFTAALDSPVAGPYGIVVRVRVKEFRDEGEKGYSKISPAVIIGLVSSQSNDNFPEVKLEVSYAQPKIAQSRLNKQGKQTFTTVKADNKIESGEWVVLAGTCGADGTLQLFINGNEAASAKRFVPKFDLDKVLIGGAAKRVLVGDISDVMIYDQGLTLQNISEVTETLAQDEQE